MARDQGVYVYIRSKWCSGHYRKLRNLDCKLSLHCMNANKPRGKKGKGGKPKPKSRSAAPRAIKKFYKEQAAPLANSKRLETGNADVLQTGSGRQRVCTIRHSEMFDTLSTTSGLSTFTPRRFRINPGQSALFPWLSVQAAGWERYRFKYLRIRLLSRLPASSTSTVTIGCDYDATDASPDSILELMSYQGTVQDAGWKDITFVASPKSLTPNGEFRYTRNGTTVPPDAELRQDDSGNLWIDSTSEVSAIVGSLVVDYEVEFAIPALISGDTASNAMIIPSIGGDTNHPYGPDALTVGTIKVVVEPYGISAKGVKVFLDGLVPGTLYRLFYHWAGTNMDNLPWSNVWSAEVVLSIVQAAYTYATYLVGAYDFVSSERHAVLSIFAGSASTADVISQFSTFSLANAPNLDPTS